MNVYHESLQNFRTVNISKFKTENYLKIISNHNDLDSMLLYIDETCQLVETKEKPE